MMQLWIQDTIKQLCSLAGLRGTTEYSISSAHRIYTPFFYLFILSFIAYATLAYIFPVSFYPDSEQYVRTAKALINQPGGEFYYYRTWGYPLIMNLLGVTTLTSFYPLLCLQLVSAALIPSLIYATLVNVYHKTAIYAALIACVSFAPGFLSNVIMTDQISMFLRYLLIYIASICIFKSSKTYPYVFLVVIGFILYMMRPSDALTFFIIPSSLFLFQPGNWRKLTAITLIFILAVLMFNIIKNHVSHRYTKKHHIISTSVTGSMTGKMLFFNVYAVGSKVARRATLDVKNGPYSKKLINTLIAWGITNPIGIVNYAAQGRSAYPDIYAKVNSPKEFANALIAEQGLFAHSIMWLALDQQIGKYEADNIFLRAAIESYLANPKAFLLLYDGMVEFFLSGDVVYNSGKKEIWNSHPSLSIYLPENPAFPNKLKHELKKSSEKMTLLVLPVSEFLFFWITSIKIIATMLATAFLPANFIFGRKLSCLTLMIIIMLLYNALIAVTFASPHFRYTLPHVPLIIMLAALGITSFKMLISSVNEKRAANISADN